jgi:hypothetical protein
MRTILGDVTMHVQALIMVLLVAGMSGCATLSKDECRTADWRTIGFEDGARGYTSQRISEHREACAEYGITPDFDAYMSGHRQGLRQYCIPQRGFQLGRQGASYSGFCPSDLEPEFLAQYRFGQKVFQVEQQIREIKAEQQKLKNEQHELLHEIEDNEKLIISDNTTPRVRAELLEQNKKLEQIVHEKDAIILELDEEIRRLEARIDRMLGKYKTEG